MQTPAALIELKIMGAFVTLQAPSGVRSLWSLLLSQKIISEVVLQLGILQLYLRVPVQSNHSSQIAFEFS